MPLQRIVENYLTVSYIGQSGQVETTKYRDNLFNRVWALKNDGVKDVTIQSGEYIKKDFNALQNKKFIKGIFTDFTKIYL